LSTLVDNTIGDLLAVPGLRGLLLLDAASAPRMYRLDHEMSSESIDSLARGISQVVGRLGGSATRIELRYAEGRFYIQPLQSGMVVALLTDARPNLPLLSLSLEALVTAASTEREAVLETFRAGELLRLKAMANGTTAKPEDPTATAGPRGIARSNAEPVRASNGPGSTSAVFDKGESSSGSPFDVASHRPPALASLSYPPPAPSVAPPSITGADSLATHGELAALLTRVSAAAARYLGRSVIANYWRQCQRGATADLFEARQDGSIVAFDARATADGPIQAAAGDWARTFVDRCTLIVVDIREGVLSSLGETGRALLEANNDAGDDARPNQEVA